MRRLIAVMTCHGKAYRAKADAQRATWASDSRVRDFADVKFFLGRPPDGREPERDEVFVDVPDDYSGIPAKVQEICYHAVVNGYGQVAKLDDDVYVVPSRLATLPLKGDYVGRFRGPVNCYPAHFACGFTYWLSANAAQFVSVQLWNRDWMDERFVANALALQGIGGRHDSFNYVVSGPFTSPEALVRRPVLCNGTFYCQYGAAAMLEMHKHFAAVEPVPHHPGLSSVPLCRPTRAEMMQPPIDQIPLEKRKRYAL